MDIDKPLLVPYRPRGEVPIFIRRHGPNIQPIPIVDGQVHDVTLQQNAFQRRMVTAASLTEVH